MARTKQTARGRGGKFSNPPVPVMAGAFGQNSGASPFAGAAAGGGHTGGATATVAPEYGTAFNDLGSDVLGEDGSCSAAGGAAAAAGGAPAAGGGGGDSESAAGRSPFLAFDFRRGAANWPKGVTMITGLDEMEALAELARNELLEEIKRQQEEADAAAVPTGTAAAGQSESVKTQGERSAKGKGSRSPAASGRLGGSGGGGGGAPGSGQGPAVMLLTDSESSEDEDADKFDEQGHRVVSTTVTAPTRPDADADGTDGPTLEATADTAAPAGAVFEELADGSTALVLRAGCRLQLCVKDLLDDEWKARERNGKTSGEQAKKNKKKQKQKKESLENRSLGVDGVGAYGNYNYSYDVGGVEPKKKVKQFIGAYTITMDVKLAEEPPSEGLSLFQARVAYIDPDGNSMAVLASDGECVVNNAGGVGRLGAYGDVTKAKVEPNRWRRVVITVKCKGEKDQPDEQQQQASSGFGALPSATKSQPNNKAKGGMRTYVDSRPCATVEGDGGEFAAGGRYSIDADHGLLLFSSTVLASMPGIAVRYVRVDKACAGEAQVMADRARDRVISMYNEKREQEIDEQRRGLVLAQLFPKARPIWLAPTLSALFGDAFIEGSTFEGQSAMPWSFAVFNLAVQTMLADQAGLVSTMSGGSAVRSAVADVLYVMRRSAPCFTMMQRLLKAPNDGQLFWFLRKLKKLLAGLGVGESMLAPAFVGGQEILFLIRRKTTGVFRFVVINTDPERGLKHHEVTANTPGSKLRFRSSMVLDNVPESQALDDVFWMAVYNLSLTSDAADTDRFYDILLPFLTGRSVEESLVEAHSAGEAEQQLGGACGDWRSPQRSNTSYVRCLLEAVNFMLRARDVSSRDSKVVGVAIRAQFVDFIRRDLMHVRPDVNGAKVIEMACSQLSYATSKLAAAWDDQEEVAKEDVVQPEADQAGASTGTDTDTDADGIGARTNRMQQAVESVRILVSGISAQVADILEEAVETPPLLDLTGPRGGEQVLGCTDAAEDDDDPAVVQSYDMLCPEVEQVPPDPGQAIPAPPYMAVDLTQVPRRVHTREAAIDALRTCDRLCVLIENQKHCIKNRKFLQASFIQHVMTTVVPMPKPRAVGDDVRARLKAEGGRKRRAEQCRLVLVARNVLAYRDEEAAAAAVAASEAAELAAKATLAADGGGRVNSESADLEHAKAAAERDNVSEPAEAGDGDDADAFLGEQRLMRALLDAAANAALECLEDVSARSAVFDRRFVPTELRAGPGGANGESGGVLSAVVGCVILTFSDPEAAKLALEQIKPRSQVLGIVARPFSAAGSRFQIVPPSAAEGACGDSDGLPQPDLERGRAEEEAMAWQAECMWDDDVSYGLQESLLSTLHRLMEHFAAAALSIPQSRAFDAACCVVPGCIAAIADSIMRRAAIDHPSAVCTHLFGRTSKGKQLGVPGYGLSVGSFATQTATCLVHAPELVAARTAVLDYFRSPSQRKLDKIYDWETGFALRPTRPTVKYMRSVLRESANLAAAVEQDRGGSGAAGIIVMLLSRAPTASCIHKDFPEFFAYRDISFWWKYFLNPDMSAFPNNPLQMAMIGSGTSLPEIPRMDIQLCWNWVRSHFHHLSCSVLLFLVFVSHSVLLVWRCVEPRMFYFVNPQNQQERGYQVTAVGMQAAGALHCAPNPAMYIGRPLPIARWPSTATPSFHVAKPAIRGEDDIICKCGTFSFSLFLQSSRFLQPYLRCTDRNVMLSDRKNLPTFADSEVVDTAGKTVEASLLESAASKKHHATLLRRSKATGARAAKAQRAALPHKEDGQQSVLSQRDSELLLCFLTVPYIRMPLVL